MDSIVRRTLLERSLSLHYYPEMLFHQSAAIRELSKDTIAPINTVRLSVSSYGSCELPSDFVDEIAVSLPVGQMLSPLAKNDNITPLRSHSTTTGQFVPYSDSAQNDSQTFWDVPAGFGAWFWNVDSFGEPTGRFFGAPGGTSAGYKVIRERRQIQLTEGFIGDDSSIVLMYVGNGQSVDNATQVDWRAFRAIQTFSNWMSSANRDNIFSPEARTYYNEKRLLRAEMNDLSITDIKNIMRNNYHAAIKS